MSPAQETPASAGFWRRLAAAWVDAFVLYALASSVATLTALGPLRIALEPSFVLGGAVYGAASLAWQGQTIGMRFVGIRLAMVAGGKPRLRHVLVREALGKWGIGVAVPVAVGRAVVGQAWVATLFDALVVLPWLLLQLVQFLLAKRAWYDLLAGTRVERVPGSRGRPIPAFAALAGVAVLGLGAKATDVAWKGWLPCRLELYQRTGSTAPYEDFLRRGQATPVDYIIDLFDRHDVVVICERLHPEGSQWELLHEVISDPRFVERVGHVFTEYGQVALQGYLDEFMATDGLSAGEVQERVLHIMRHWPVWPVWINTNFYTYLTRLYSLNQSLPPAQRIRHHFTDMSIDWPNATRDGYLSYRASLGNRDQWMAQRIIEELAALGTPAEPPKCLVVMNYRHAFDLTGREPSAERFNTYEFLKDIFGDRAANVLLNTRILLVAPIAGGAWDAAFERTGCRAAGFDLAGSPFGEDPFDLFPWLPSVRGRLAYADVFTGFVQAHRPEEQYIQHGIPGYFAGFEEEAMRRAAFLGEGYERTIEFLIDEEASGNVAVKRPLPDRRYEAWIDACLLGLAGIGLLLGVGLFAATLRVGSPR